MMAWSLTYINIAPIFNVFLVDNVDTLAFDTCSNGKSNPSFLWSDTKEYIKQSIPPWRADGCVEIHNFEDQLDPVDLYDSRLWFIHDLIIASALREIGQFGWICLMDFVDILYSLKVSS